MIQIERAAEQHKAPHGFHAEARKPTYAESLIPDKAQLFAMRERLRYKGYVRAGTLGSFMQIVGDCGRKLLPHLAALRALR